MDAFSLLFLMFTSPTNFVVQQDSGAFKWPLVRLFIDRDIEQLFMNIDISMRRELEVCEVSAKRNQKLPPASQ